MTLDINILNNCFSAERDWNVRSYCIDYSLLSGTKQLNTLNNIRALLKGVLFGSHACNFVHARISLRARCMHARHRARNLLSPDL